MAGVRRGAFTCVRWQVTLCDHIWQVTSRSPEMGFPWRAISAFTFFYMYWWYVIAGYYSFRGRHGTVFISALCEMLRQYHSTLSLLGILTRVNYEVAYFFESRVHRDNPDHKLLSHKKQMPTIVSMLTKHLYFIPPKLKRLQTSPRWAFVLEKKRRGNVGVWANIF